MSWKRVQLSEVLIQQKETVELKSNEEYTLVTISKTGAITKRETKKGVEIKGKSALKIKSGDFIYSRLAVHSGAFGIIPKELNDAIVTNEMPSFEIKDNILPEFLIHSLTLPDFNHQITHLTKGVGRTRVKEKSFLGLEINLPTLSQQKQIVTWLTSCSNISDDISANQIAQLDLVKQLRQAFLREAMQGKLIPQDPNDEPASVLLEKIKAEKERLIKEKKIKKQKPLPPITQDEIPFEIPENWVWCRFYKVCEIESNLVNPNDYLDYPHIAPNNIEKNTGRLLEYKSVREDELISSKHLFYPDQLLYSKVRPKLNKVVKVDFTGLCSADMYPLKPYINSDFMLWCMLSEYFLVEVDRFDNRVKMPKINQKQLSQIPIPLPPLSEQELIVAKLDELMQYCDALEASITASQQQNELLLQQVLREALEPKEKEVEG